MHKLCSKTAHAKLENDLRALSFANDTSKSAPICRWNYQDISVNIMPSDADMLDYSNIGLDKGIENKIKISH